MLKFLILLLFILTVCASPATATDFDIEQIKELKIKPSPGKALIYLYRSGAALEDYKLFFDDKKIPALFAKSFILIETDPGRHKIEAKGRGTGMNRAGSGSYELYSFEADRVYFIENVIGLDSRNYVYNVPISEFWKRKESHWLEVRDKLSFLDFVGANPDRNTPLTAAAALTQRQEPVAETSLSLPVPNVTTPTDPSLNAIAVSTRPAPSIAVAKPSNNQPLPSPRIAEPPPAPSVEPAASAINRPGPPIVLASPTAPNPPAQGLSTARVTAGPLQNPYGIAVIIGNRNYSKNNRDLPDVDFAHNDAQAIYDYVHNVLGYREGNIIFLKDATQAQLLSVFGIPGDPEGKLFNWVRPKLSDVFIYYSGHGVPGAKDGRSYLLPVDADPTTVQINGYLLETLYANLAAIPAKSVTVILDACFSGSSAGGAVFQKASSITLRTVDTPALLPNGTIISATSQNEVASWDQEAKLGLFTHAFLEGLKGAADGQGFGNSDGNVTVAELKGFLAEEVSYAARRHYGRKQTPQVFGQEDRVLTTLR